MVVQAALAVAEAVLVDIAVMVVLALMVFLAVKLPGLVVAVAGALKVAADATVAALAVE